MAELLHAMLLVRSYSPVRRSTFELVNVHIVLLFHLEHEAALALRPELVVDVCNFGVVKLLAWLQLGGDLRNSGGRASLNRTLHINALSLRSRGSGCDCVAWPLRLSTVGRGLSSDCCKSLAQDISSGSLTRSIRPSASTYGKWHNSARHYAVRSSHSRHGLYQASNFRGDRMGLKEQAFLCLPCLLVDLLLYFLHKWLIH